MRLKKSLQILSVFLLLSLAACSSPTVPAIEKLSPEPTTYIQDDSFRTLVAGTLTAVAESATPTQEFQPLETATEQFIPTEDPNIIPTEQIFPTRMIVSISINDDLNCRKGPATYYPIVAILKKGVTVEAFGRDLNNTYFFVQDPVSGSNGCWILGSFGTITGNLEILPVFTPIPTPRPTYTPTPPPTPFTVSFVGLTQCGTGFAANFSIVNTGKYRLESVRIQNKVAGIDAPFVHLSDYFIQWSKGAEYLRQKELLVGEGGIVSTCQPGGFTSDPTGLKVTSKIAVCTGNSLSGICYNQELTFIP
jgi:hypothetical protein